jgi:SAM-dependent methyltransferase
LKSLESADLVRLRREYTAREARLADRDLYSPFNPAYLFRLHQRERAVLKLLRRRGFETLAGRRILEVGCGRGEVVGEFLGYGARLGRLHATDLLFNRTRAVKRWLSGLPLTCSDGQDLPYAAGSFDLVLQYMAFSSILDDGIRTRLANELLRVLRQPGGMILWYDFWLNPTNPHARGVRPAEIRRLFPGCQFEFQRITLAPPLARRTVPVSWQLSQLLEIPRILNTHYLVAITPE